MKNFFLEQIVLPLAADERRQVGLVLVYSAPLDGSAVVNGEKAAQIHVLLNGQKTGKFPAEMPAWKQLSDTDIAAVITYTRNSWSNKPAENIVQPAEVLAARK